MSGTGGGGFSACGGTRAVAINGNTNSITWGATSFVASGQRLLFGSLTADGLLVYSNGLSLGTTGTNIREIFVTDNVATNTDVAQLANVITGSSGNSLRKTGNGVLDLSGANTYAGLTTNAAGTLLINGSLSAGGGAVVTLAVATLGGTSIVNRAVTIDEGGILAPGNSIGTFTVSSLTLADNALLAFELGTPSNSDMVVVNNTFVLGGLEFTQFSWSTNAGFGEGVYTLFDAQTLSGSLGAITNGQIAGLLLLGRRRNRS